MLLNNLDSNKKIQNNVIREIDIWPIYKLDLDYEYLIIYNPKTGEFSSEHRILDRLFNRSNRYFILNPNLFEQIEDIECEIFDPPENLRMKLKISCLVGMSKRRPYGFLRLMLKSNNLEYAVWTLFQNWTNSFIQISNGGIKKDFKEIENTLRNHYEIYAEKKGIRLPVINIKIND